MPSSDHLYVISFVDEILLFYKMLVMLNGSIFHSVYSFFNVLTLSYIQQLKL
jgi:hypothetical protein